MPFTKSAEHLTLGLVQQNTFSKFYMPFTKSEEEEDATEAMSGLSTPVGSASSGMMNVSESEATDAVEALEKAIKSAGSSAPGIWANVADRLLLLLLLSAE